MKCYFPMRKKPKIPCIAITATLKKINKKP